VNRAARGHLLHVLSPRSALSEVKVRAQAARADRSVTVLPASRKLRLTMPEFMLGPKRARRGAP